MRTFFGGTFLEKEELKEAGIFHPIKLEYYKKINEDLVNSNNKAKYGISIVKTEYIENDVKVYKKDINYITNDEVEEDKILKIFKENKVTPINSEEIILDLFKGKFGFNI